MYKSDLFEAEDLTLELSSGCRCLVVVAITQYACSISCPTNHHHRRNSQPSPRAAPSCLTTPSRFGVYISHVASPQLRYFRTFSTARVEPHSHIY
jgi:hypothetical protein